eukprot:g19200.t1
MESNGASDSSSIVLLNDHAWVRPGQHATSNKPQGTKTANSRKASAGARAQPVDLTAAPTAMLPDSSP